MVIEHSLCVVQVNGWDALQVHAWSQVEFKDDLDIQRALRDGRITGASRVFFVCAFVALGCVTYDCSDVQAPT